MSLSVIIDGTTYHVNQLTITANNSFAPQGVNPPPMNGDPNILGSMPPNVLAQNYDNSNEGQINFAPLASDENVNKMYQQQQQMQQQQMQQQQQIMNSYNANSAIINKSLQDKTSQKNLSNDVVQRISDEHQQLHNQNYKNHFGFTSAPHKATIQSNVPSGGTRIRRNKRKQRTRKRRRLRKRSSKR